MNTVWQSRVSNILAVSSEEMAESGLETDPLAHIHIPEVEPRTLIKAWKAYDKQKKEYLSALLVNDGIGLPAHINQS